MAIKLTKGDKVFRVCNVLFMLLFTFTIVYPFVYLISVSISDPELVIRGKIWLFPKQVTLTSYKYIIGYKNFWSAYYNTIWYTAFGTAFGLTLTLLTAYPLSRRHLKGRRFIMGFFMVTMYFSGGIVPSYILMGNLNLLDTRAVMILGPVAVYYLILVRTSMEGLPEEIFDSAKIDGASDFHIFVRIVLPLSKAIIAVIVLFIAVDFWNMYFSALIYLNRQELFPVQVLLQRILISFSMGGVMEQVQADKKMAMGQGVRYAMIIVSIIPILCVYPFIQKYFIKGMLLGAVKG